MKPGVYIDEDAMSRALVQGLRARNIDVLTVFECKMVGKNDLEQSNFSTSQDRVIYTFTVGDFCQIHKEFLSQDIEHSGIIVVNRLRYSVGEQLKQLLQLINKFDSEEMRNNLYFL
jgi:Domain of unknown function (DUF5615)